MPMQINEKRNIMWGGNEACRRKRWNSNENMLNNGSILHLLVKTPHTKSAAQWPFPAEKYLGTYLRHCFHILYLGWLKLPLATLWQNMRCTQWKEQSWALLSPIRRGALLGGCLLRTRSCDSPQGPSCPLTASQGNSNENQQDQPEGS